MAERGGIRPGAGRPRGKRTDLQKAAALTNETLLQFLSDNVEEIALHQVRAAKGLSYMYRVEKKSRRKNASNRRQYVLVTDPQEILEGLKEIGGKEQNMDATYYYITVKPGNWRIAHRIFDRLFGKPH